MTISPNPYDLNTAPAQRVPLRAHDEAPFWQRPHVETEVIKRALEGREADVLKAAFHGFIWPPRSGSHTTCFYPDHPDHNPSCRVTETGQIVCSCRGSHSVFDALINSGKARDFGEAAVQVAELLGRRDLIREPPKPRTGITLDALAAHKGLPVDYLKSIGLADDHHRGAPAVRIGYWHEDGSQLDPRYRIAATGDLKVVSAKGAKTHMYGRWYRDAVLERGFVIVVEGESDTWTLWHRGYPAIGLPGAANYRDDRDAAWFDGIPEIYAIKEPDMGGDAMMKRLASSKIASRVKVISLV
jgi:putative DNA primase/helicase